MGYERKKPLIIMIGTGSSRKYDVIKEWWQSKGKKYEYEDYLTSGWSSGFGRTISSKIKSEIDVECWMSSLVKKEISYIKDGIKYRHFPTYGNLLFEFSPSLLNTLKRISSNAKIVIHKHIIHSQLSLYLAGLFGKKIPIIMSQHGETPISIKLKDNGHYYFNRLYNYFEINCYKKVDSFMAKSIYEIQFLNNITNKKNQLRPTIGVDLDLFRPLNKEDCKKELNLDPNKHYLLYIGPYDSSKDLDCLLLTYKKLKNKEYKLITIGGSKDEPLYNEMKKLDIIIIPFCSQDLLLKYYNAASILIMPEFKLKRFMGMSTVSLESLACNTPIVSSSLVHFSKDDQTYLGKIPLNSNDLKNNIEYLINNLKEYTHCREIISKDYDNKIILSKIINDYRTLLTKYYGSI